MMMADKETGRWFFGGSFCFYFPTLEHDRSTSNDKDKRDGRTDISITHQLFILAGQDPLLSLQLAHVDVQTAGPLQQAAFAFRYHRFRLQFRWQWKNEFSIDTQHIQSNRIQSKETNQNKSRPSRTGRLSILLSCCLTVWLGWVKHTKSRWKKSPKRKGANQSYHNSQSDGLSMWSNPRMETMRMTRKKWLVSLHVRETNRKSQWARWTLSCRESGAGRHLLSNAATEEGNERERERGRDGYNTIKHSSGHFPLPCGHGRT